MKNKKVLALLVSLVLIVAVALPGTLAVSSDQDAVNSDFTVDTASPAPETQELTGGQEQPIDPENPEQPEQPETPEQPEQPELTCTCDPAPAEGEAHKEGCPLYVAPLTCTCDPAPLEGEEHKEGCPLTCTCVSQPLTGTIHKEGCPLYVAPEAPAVINHIETCLEGCTGEECTCVCHLYEKIMAAETLDEIWTLFDNASEETINALTDEMNAKIDEKIAALEPAPVPAVVIEQTKETTVPSEIVYPTVNYTNVAPFGAPATGGQG